MADTLVSVLIEHLAGLALERIEEEVRLFKDVKSDVKKLESNLTSIKAVLEDAEKKQLSDASVKNWLNRLNDVFHEIDDVLDHWNSYVLKLQIEKDGHEDPPTQPTKKVCLPKIPSPFSCFKSKVSKLTLRHDVAHKIKQLNEKLDVIAVEKERYSLFVTSAEKPVERPRSTSFVDESEVEGRDVDKEVLVGKLLEENGSQRDKGLHIIPIVGMGGIGKTTLAQLAYKDEKVKAHFDLRIWVCVSDPFDEIKVAKAIIEAAEGSAPNINELENLLQRIVKCIAGKRILLILDDVWTKDSKRWHQFRQPLTCSSRGSRVVITTRKEEVAKMMGAKNHMITLEKLSDEHCWLVFKNRAFLERSEDECNELEEIGRQIASRCKGLPLVAKSLGSLMCFKTTKSQWENVLHSELWRLKDVEEIFAPFLLSYYDLSATEKRCFSYCSIFPKDHVIRRDHLIGMWMSQNYLGHATSLEEEGRECFDSLVTRSFFQDFMRSKQDGSVTHCKMHDIVHDFAQFVMDYGCLAIQADKVEEAASMLSHEKLRHLTIELSFDEEPPSLDFTEMNKRNLRSVHIMAEGSLNTEWDIGLSCVLKLTHLRSLTLYGCGFQELPDTAGGLMHLRYLDLSWNLMSELPDALCDLCNLKTLNLSYCTELEELPKGIGKLVNLRHLFVYGCYELKGLPKGIGQLACLRRIDRLLIAEDKEAYFDIAVLKRLRNLQLRGYVSVDQCRNLRSRDEAEKLDIKNISRHVEFLELHFHEYEELITGAIDGDMEILEGLEPHQKLPCLIISNYMGATLSPNWMMTLTNLREITLSRCNKCEMLPSLGKLPSLESATFWKMQGIQKVGLEFLGITESPTVQTAIFPKLKRLNFDTMPQWEKWEGNYKSVNHTIAIMPCLTTLEFRRCPRLRELPDFLGATTFLKEVIIGSTPIIEEWCQKRTGKEWDKISHATSIQLNSNYVRKDGLWI